MRADIDSIPKVNLIDAHTRLPSLPVDASICAGLTIHESLRSRNRTSSIRKTPVYKIFMREGAIYYFTMATVISESMLTSYGISSIPIGINTKHCSCLAIIQLSTSPSWANQTSQFKDAHTSSCLWSMLLCPAAWFFLFETPTIHSSIQMSTSNHFGLACNMTARNNLTGKVTSSHSHREIRLHWLLWTGMEAAHLQLLSSESADRWWYDLHKMTDLNYTSLASNELSTSQLTMTIQETSKRRLLNKKSFSLSTI